LFNSSLDCDGPCSLEFIDEGITSKTYTTKTQNVKYNLKNGTHILRWDFSKFDIDIAYPQDHAIIYSIVITGTTSGGSAGCVSCDAGSISPGGKATYMYFF
jgi:hypothetical protein